jgi:hypothetical protein
MQCRANMTRMYSTTTVGLFLRTSQLFYLWRWKLCRKFFLFHDGIKRDLWFEKLLQQKCLTNKNVDAPTKCHFLAFGFRPWVQNFNPRFDRTSGDRNNNIIAWPLLTASDRLYQCRTGLCANVPWHGGPLSFVCGPFTHKTFFMSLSHEFN